MGINRAVTRSRARPTIVISAQSLMPLLCRT